MISIIRRRRAAHAITPPTAPQDYAPAANSAWGQVTASVWDQAIPRIEVHSTALDESLDHLAQQRDQD